MRLTIVGCGDAFGSGGRSNTCFWLETNKTVLAVDFGASALPALKALKLDPSRLDAVILSHLHGDHFGGLPFLLLDAQFLSRRDKPLLIAGPPGTRARLDSLMEAVFPKSTKSTWKFSWNVQEIEVEKPNKLLDYDIMTMAVIHQSGTPSTAVRLTIDGKVFAYSGDTEWTEALLPIAKNADLFICECYNFEGALTGHLNWQTLKEKLPALAAKRVMLTHMNPTVLARLDEVKAAGVRIAEDGLVLQF